MSMAISSERQSRWSYLPLPLVVAVIRMTSGNRLSPGWAGAPVLYLCQLVAMALSTMLVGHFPG
jgi:hypothetical protein